MSNWFRFYDDAVNDPKIIDLSDDLYRAWVNCLCIAAKNDGVLPEIKHVATTLRMKPAKAAAVITKLVMLELIDNHDGVFAPHNWQGRQFKSDDSGPRVKRHREKLRNASRNAKCNVTVTGDGNALEAEEKKVEGEQSRAGALDDEDLKRKVAALQAGVSAHFVSRGQAIPNLDRCLHWLTLGYGPGTVLAAIEAVLKRGKPISTLDYFDGAIKDRHVADAPTAALVDTMADWYLIIEGTPEEACWQQYTRETTKRPMFICDQIHEGRTVRGAKKPTLFPPGFNDFGERINPASEEHAA